MVETVDRNRMLTASHFLPQCQHTTITIGNPGVDGQEVDYWVFHRCEISNSELQSALQFPKKCCIY